MLVIELDPDGYERILRRLAAWWSVGYSCLSPERIVTVAAVRLDSAA